MAQPESQATVPATAAENESQSEGWDETEGKPAEGCARCAAVEALVAQLSRELKAMGFGGTEPLHRCGRALRGVFMGGVPVCCTREAGHEGACWEVLGDVW